MQLSNLQRARCRGASTAGPAYGRERGFSLMEVMVALVVSTVGLLGLAKMEALGLSSTSVAGSRSLAAIEASSLAAAMHANPGYWAAGIAPPSIVITAGTPYPLVTSCFNVAGPGSCTPANMMAYDLNQWSTSLNQVLPGSLATINCTQPVANTPVTCTIQLQWTENGVAVSAKQSLMSNLANPTYVLFVQP
jgi:type IV pilus assembly protein PilV